MNKLLYILQIASPTLPVGAYSYSEGLETLVEQSIVRDYESFFRWLSQELQHGSIVVETAIMFRAYQSLVQGDLQKLATWNAWLSAARETEELRQQSWQMGRSLVRLLLSLQPEIVSVTDKIGDSCNYAIAFGIAAAHWQIDSQDAILAYFQSWVTNLIGAGVKLIPLGQTDGQKLLLNLNPLLIESTNKVIDLPDENLASCSWGLSLASMAHQGQYTRLFRS